jgi:hypothetical protein
MHACPSVRPPRPRCSGDDPVSHPRYDKSPVQAMAEGWRPGVSSEHRPQRQHHLAARWQPGASAEHERSTDAMLNPYSRQPPTPHTNHQHHPGHSVATGSMSGARTSCSTHTPGNHRTPRPAPGTTRRRAAADGGRTARTSKGHSGTHNRLGDRLLLQVFRGCACWSGPTPPRTTSPRGNRQIQERQLCPVSARQFPHNGHSWRSWT